MNQATCQRTQQQDDKTNADQRSEACCLTMKRNLVTQAPVVHFLSPSPDASRRARERIARVLSKHQDWKLEERVVESQEIEDQWQTLLESRLLAPAWDSIGLSCPRTGTLLHWISVSGTRRHSTTTAPLRILGIQDASGSVAEARNALAQALVGTTSHTRIAARQWMGMVPAPSDVLGPDELPVLGWSANPENDDSASASPNATGRSSSISWMPGVLKEVTLPYFPGKVYQDGCNSTLIEKLGHSPLLRPSTGLYQYPSGLCIRPLPAAMEDRQLSPVSLVFHVEDLNETTCDQEAAEDGNLLVAKVGYTGIGKGQLILRHPEWMGLDLRFCEATRYSSMFAEAQEALLAGSLPELQSEHVVDPVRGTIDKRNNRVDCWVEFRANVANPRGFFNDALTKGRHTTSTRVAKAPDLPYQ